MSKDLLNLEELKDQAEPLSEEQNEAIRQSAYKQVKERAKDPDADEDDEDPFKAPLDKKKVIESDDRKEDEDETPEAKKSREEAEAKAKAEEDAKAAELASKEKAEKLEAARKKEEKDLTDEEKGLIKEETEAKAQARQKEVEEYTQAYAEKRGISEVQAKKEVEKIYGVLDKYKENPKDMAQALYHLATKLSQTTEEIAALKNAPGPKEIVIKGKKLSEEETRNFLVPKYREFQPEITEGMDDDKVFKLAWKEYEERVRIVQHEAVKERKQRAEDRRQEVLDAIPEEDKKFLKDVRGSLERVSDSEILSDDFDVTDYVYWARGKSYHRDIKAAVEKAVTDALKDKKILGDKNGGGGGAAPVKKAETVSLSEEEKSRALDMYASLQLPDEEKFKLYNKFKESISTKKKE